ncbi:MAG: hypothetical protein WBP81_00560, partial [Solirubrobacteraceae bacterium]
TLADEQTAAAYSGMTGVIDALRGGTYEVATNRVQFVVPRVVTDATRQRNPGDRQPHHPRAAAAARTAAHPANRGTNDPDHRHSQAPPRAHANQDVDPPPSNRADGGVPEQSAAVPRLRPISQGAGSRFSAASRSSLNLGCVAGSSDA